MEWRDEGIVLGARPHGESGAIVDVFTPERGRHAGVMRGGRRERAAVLQPGTQVAARWRARLSEHLGTFVLEPVRHRSGALLADRLALAGLASVCGLLRQYLPERAPHPALYARTVQLLDVMAVTPAWTLAYLHWELALLEELGFGLDLSACAVTGATEGLVYVSPKSGRAVTAAGAGEWADRLLPLPPCLLGEGSAPDAEIAVALQTTGYFLEERLGHQNGRRGMPPARARLAALVGRAGDAPFAG